MSDQNPANPRNLRVLNTARTESAINAAAEEGFWPLLKPVQPGEQIHYMLGVYQHKESGKIIVSGDFRFGPGADYEPVIPHTTYYPYHFPIPFAAYLVPPDLSTGETVWLDDLIEDVVGVWGNQGYHPRLPAAEAIWNGKDFEIQFDPGRDAECWVG